MRPVLAFDMNGTLLDTSVLDSHFSRLIGSSAAALSSSPESLRREWFLETIGLANVATVTGYYEPLPDLAKAALLAIAERRGVSLTETDVAAFMAELPKMRAFTDVSPALERLRASKVRMVVLTNAVKSKADEALSNAGIASFFERVLSVDSLQVYKPHPKVYQYTAQELGVPPSAIMLVAAHAWDTTGAMRAGCQAAFVARPGEVLPVNAPTPQVVVDSLTQLADEVLKIEIAA